MRREERTGGKVKKYTQAGTFTHSRKQRSKAHVLIKGIGDGRGSSHFLIKNIIVLPWLFECFFVMNEINQQKQRKQKENPSKMRVCMGRLAAKSVWV